MNLYTEKFTNAIQNTFFDKLPLHEQEFIKEKAFEYKFSYQEINKSISRET